MSYLTILKEVCKKREDLCGDIITKYFLYLNSIKGPSVRQLITTMRYEADADLEEIIKSGFYDDKSCYKTIYMIKLRTDFKF